MFRELLIIALLAAGVWMYRRLRNRMVAGGRTRPRRRPPYEEMVRCNYCGMHVPRATALGARGEGYFCSDAHRLAVQTMPDKDKR